MQTAVKVQSISNILSSSWRGWAVLLISLGKIRISLLVTLSAAAGYILASGRAEGQMVLPIVGVFILALGSCGLNQYQERGIDELMERTRSRVLPSKRLNPNAALTISLAEILFGSLLLLFGANRLVLMMALFSVLWYNGVYTSLKQKTAFAVVPGALIGAIPPSIGWVSAGGDIFDPGMWGIAFFLFIWQAPHFWLLLLDFTKDYEAAGLPSITSLFSTRQIKRIVFIWLLSTGVACLLLPLFGFGASAPARLLLLGMTIWFFWTAILFLKSPATGAMGKQLFTRINLYALVVVFFITLDKLIRTR